MMSVIDFHSHILPDMDDGSRNAQVSFDMCQANAAAGVDVVVATPHFYACEDRVDAFLERRDVSFKRLQKKAASCGIQMIAGAEVAFFTGISRADQIAALTLGDTNLLLLELPFQAWDAAILREVEMLTLREHFQLIFAHLERYLKIPGNQSGIRTILKMPAYVQINAESLLDRHKRKHLLGMFRKGQAHLLGSDSHGMHRRPPNLGEGRRILERELGWDFMNQIDELGSRLLHLS